MGNEIRYSIRQDALRICDLPAQLRPREEFARVGAEHVSDAVLLALILRTGQPGVNVMEVAQQLLRRFGSLTALGKASVEEICQVDSIGPVKAQMLKAAMELAQRLARESVGERPVITSPEQAAAVLRERARLLDHEVVWVLFLDVRNRLIGEPRQLFEGGFSTSIMEPRKVFKEALACAACSVILAHNHPSGDCAPSPQDIQVTRQLVDAGHVMGIAVQDHIIIGRRNEASRSDFLSLREAALVSFGKG
jgi:DNA repair protein RadC